MPLVFRPHPHVCRAILLLIVSPLLLIGAAIFRGVGIAVALHAPDGFDIPCGRLVQGLRVTVVVTPCYGVPDVRCGDRWGPIIRRSRS